MEGRLVARQSVVIGAPVTRVWDALVTPEIIRQYLWGTEAVSDWQAGSPIVYRGVWRGQSYEDRGEIIALEPERLLVTRYWSSRSGLPDNPENHNRVSYVVEPVAGGAQLTIIQENVRSEAERVQSEENWARVLSALKDLLER